MSARNSGISVESLNSLNAQIASQEGNLSNEITSEQRHNIQREDKF